MILREFKQNGIDEFRFRLKTAKESGTEIQLEDLLENNEYTKILPPSIEIEKCHFILKIDAVEYLYNKLKGIDNLYQNIGLWSWIGAFYFDELCPIVNGKRYISKEYSYKYILDSDFHAWKRHLLAPEVRLYHYHKSNALILLSNPVYEHSRMVEDYISRIDFNQSEHLMSVIRKLYWDEKAKIKIIKGASGDRIVPGTFRSFIVYCQQLSLTYDLYSITPEKFLEMLPSEFERYKKKRSC